MAASGSSSAGVGIAIDDATLETATAVVEDAGFSSAKMAMIRALCQNNVFTTEQAAELIGTVSMSSDKLEALDLFAERLSNPSEADAIVEQFSFSSDKDTAREKLSGMSPAKAGTLAAFPVESDGHRSSEDVDRFLGALDAASMSSDKVEAARAECEEHPTPPFSCEQMLEVLKRLSFSDDAKAVLEMFAGPAIVYPMTCDEIVSVLEVFSMSDDRIAVLPSLKPFVKDAQNKLAIVASFSFSSDKVRAEEILRDVLVRLEPSEPPEAAVQDVLRRIGSCPAGYRWRKVPSGWRCAAGGHYVSDAQVSANL